MLNLKIKTMTLMCLSSAKQHQFAVHKVTCRPTCTRKYHFATVVRLSYMWFIESATVNNANGLLLTLDVQKPKSFQLQAGFTP